MKKIASLILAFTILFSSLCLAATVENKEVDSFLKTNVTYAESEALADALGLLYSNKNGVCTFTEPCDDPSALQFNINDPSKVTILSFEGEKDSLKLHKTFTEAIKTPAEEYGGKLYVPLRYVSEFFGARVYYDGSAKAERTKYYRPMLLRTNGTLRETVSVPEDFETALIAGDWLIYSAGKNLYRRSLKEDSGDEYLCKAGSTHISGDHLFVFSGGQLISVNIKTKKQVTVCEGVTMVGYTQDDYAWCETLSGIFIYDKYANYIDKITGSFHNAFDYHDGYVYYTDKDARLFKAKADGSDAQLLAKAAYYPDYIDGFIYYNDTAANYRRVDVSTKEDIMVYGLNLERIINLGDKFVLNYYSPLGNHKMYISNPDGTDFKPFSSPDIACASKPFLYKDALLVTSFFDGLLYYACEDFSVKLSDDSPSSVAGVYNDFVYYVID